MRWSGSGVAPGTAVAPARRVGGPPSVGDAVTGAIDPARVEQAFHEVAADLDALAARTRAGGRKAAADIVAVGALIAADPGLVQAARDAATSPDPLAAITRAIDEHAKILESLSDETLRERAADVRQVGRRVLDRLTRPHAPGAGGGSAASDRLAPGDDANRHADRQRDAGSRREADHDRNADLPEGVGLSESAGPTESAGNRDEPAPPGDVAANGVRPGGTRDALAAEHFAPKPAEPMASSPQGADVGAASEAGAEDAFVLVAEELGPADLLEHLGQGLVGAVTVHGGANAHAAIVARSVGLPLVAGVAPEVLDLPESTMVLVDADAGLVVADPAEDEIAGAARAAARDRVRRAVLAAERDLPHVTADGRPFTISCNVATDIEVRTGRTSGAAGIGLLRTELPFLEFERWPTEADHRRALRPILAEAAGWPVTLRLLDFANDKIPPFLHGASAGLDALLNHPEALRAQLRAAVQAGRDTGLRIMVPMVTCPDQVRTVRAAVEAISADALPVGAMVETLEAVAGIDALCEVCDFLSIGTNDLTAQALELDRRDPRALPELTAHPRVLRLIGQVVSAADRTGVAVSVCGDSGAHPTTLPLLVGAGVRQVSVACARIDEVRYRMRRLRVAECAELFAEALTLAGPEEVHELVRRRAEIPLP